MTGQIIIIAFVNGPETIKELIENLSSLQVAEHRRLTLHDFTEAPTQ
jgi:hypothetical protein